MEIYSTAEPRTSSQSSGRPVRPNEPARNTPELRDSESSQPTEQAGKDRVSISPEGKNLSDNNSQSGSNNLDQEELKQLQYLKQRDQEVRTHEQAHLAAAGSYARGGPSFTYQRGPNGVAYAVGGEVGIDLSKEATPEATLLKMQTVKRAALAPASPSAADRSIAAQATIKAAQARQEVLIQNQEDLLQTEQGQNPLVSQSSGNDQSGKAAGTEAPSTGRLRTMIAAYQNNIGA